MSISEADAKTKACFQAQTFAGSQQVADGPGPHCIASDCMSWRWSRADYSAERVFRTHPLASRDAAAFCAACTAAERAAPMGKPL